jgi:hypothetical protein
MSSPGAAVGTPTLNSGCGNGCFWSSANNRRGVACCRSRRCDPAAHVRDPEAVFGHHLLLATTPKRSNGDFDVDTLLAACLLGNRSNEVCVDRIWPFGAPLLDAHVDRLTCSVKPVEQFYDPLNENAHPSTQGSILWIDDMKRVGRLAPVLEDWDK